MPIVVAHEPSALGIGAVAFQAGLGQYRQRQQQLALQQQDQALRWTQMALQNQASLRNDYLQAQALQAQNQRYLMDAQQRQQMFGAEQQFRQQQLAQQDQWRQAQDQLARDQMQQQTDIHNLDWTQRREMQDADNAWRTGFAEDQRKAAFEDFKNRQAEELTIEGQRYKAAVERQKAIVDAKVASGQIASPMAQSLYDEIDARAAGVDTSKFMRQPTNRDQAQAQLQQQWDAQVLEKPDGSLWQAITRNGESKFEQIGVKGDQEEMLRMKLYGDYRKALAASAAKGTGPDALTGMVKPPETPLSYDDWKLREFPTAPTKGIVQPPPAGGQIPPPAPPPPQGQPLTVEQAADAVTATAGQFPPQVAEARKVLAELARKYPTLQAQQQASPADIAAYNAAKMVLFQYAQQHQPVPSSPPVSQGQPTGMRLPQSSDVMPVMAGGNM